MTWNIVRRRPLKLCVPWVSTSEQLELYRVYPSKVYIGRLSEVLPGFYCRDITPGDNIIEAFAVKTSDGGVVDIATMHYYIDIPPESIDTVVVVSKLPEDVPEGVLFDAVRGVELGSIKFEDRGDIAIGYLTLPSRGLYYAIIRLSGGVFVEELFFRRRVSIALQSLIYTIALSTVRRVIVVA